MVKIIEPSVSLIWVTPDAEVTIERIARTCYMSEGKIAPGSSIKLIEKLITSGHEAMLEHASASFRIVTDRGVTHELVRHRIASYAQESTRFCNYFQERFGSEITVVRPSLDPAGTALWQDACRDAEFYYMNLIRQGVSPQAARSVLPTCLKAEIVMTANFREWRHFLRLRLAKAAHPQMREVAKMLWDQLRLLSSACFDRREFKDG